MPTVRAVLMVVVGVMRFVAGSAHAVLLIAKVAVGEDGTDAHSASNTSLSTGTRCAKSSLNPLDESGVTVSEVRGKVFERRLLANLRTFAHVQPRQRNINLSPVSHRSSLS